MYYTYQLNDLYITQSEHGSTLIGIYLQLRGYEFDPKKIYITSYPMRTIIQIYIKEKRVINFFTKYIITFFKTYNTLYK